MTRNMMMIVAPLAVCSSTLRQRPSECLRVVSACLPVAQGLFLACTCAVGKALATAAEAGISARVEAGDGIQ